MEFKQYLEALQVLGPMSSQDTDKLSKMVDLNADFDFVVFWNGRSLNVTLQPNVGTNGIKINAAKKMITLPKDFEYSPYEISAIEELNKMPLLSDYKVMTQDGLTNLAALTRKIKVSTGSYQTWANPKYDFRSATKPFGVKIIKAIHERNFYHTTFKKYVRFIKVNGLTPSKVFADIENELVQSGKIKAGDGVPLGLIPRDGWSSSLNPEKQRAVYLYLDKDKATALAKYLAYRNQEEAVVLEIDGNALRDYSKLVVDEDALRDDSSVSKKLSVDVPHFYFSALSHMKSIGYTAVIPPQFIKIAAEFSPPDDVDDYDF